MPPEITALNTLKLKLCDNPHTLLCYITMSGNGIRVIYPFLGDDYPAAFAKGNDYYQQLIGKKADFQCKNVNRLSGLAYDPDAYYNSDAISFSAEEISLFHTETTKKNQKQKKLEHINTYYEQIIKPKLANDQIIYQPGKHNDYVMRVGYMFAKKRYAHATVLEWALLKFPEYDGVEQVIKSCYKNTPGASEKSSGGGGGGNGGSDNRFASVEEIRNFLDGHIRLRYNLITQRYEFLEIPEGASLSSDKPPRLEQKLVDLYFRKPSEGETGEFVSVARAMQIIGCNITQKLSSQKIGKAFSDLDFKKSRTKNSRGFIAIIRTAEEIRNYQISLGIDASGDLPF